MTNPDVCIAGGGIIGLSLARSLTRSGLRVVVLTRGAPMAEASQAAAGMLAVEDPENPPQLLALSRLSRSLYAQFLDELAEDSGERVVLQTRRTLQIVASAEAQREATPAAIDVAADLLPTLTMRAGEQAVLLDEQSLDPRELATCLVSAATACGIELRSHSTVTRARTCGEGVAVETATETIAAGAFVDCTGAWSLSTTLAPALRMTPRKGQMLTVATPPALAREALVLRSHDVYLVPRLYGPRAGQCVVGATVEDVGFDRVVHAEDLRLLLARAARLLPELARASIVDSWAGLRPATADLLPVLGPLTPDAGTSNLFVASGHYRNGILLAPATAAVMTDLILGRPPAVALDAFSPERFSSADEAH